MSKKAKETVKRQNREREDEGNGNFFVRLNSGIQFEKRAIHLKWYRVTYTPCNIAFGFQFETATAAVVVVVAAFKQKKNNTKTTNTRANSPHAFTHRRSALPYVR